MAFDAGIVTARAEIATTEEFERRDRLVVLLGASALGAAIGFAAAMFAGRWELWLLALVALPVFAYTLYLTGLTLTEAMRDGATGCASAAALHVAALLAWPMTSLFTPFSSLLFWVSPFLALTALVLFASCWRGDVRAIYRAGAQAALVAALAAHQGVFVIMGA